MYVPRPPALSATVERSVSSVDTASAWGAEFPPAASTPFVLGLAEIACHAAIASSLDAGDITVGTGATVEHLLPSRVGALLKAHAQVVSGEEGRFEFHVDVTDGDRLVATVEHRRATVSASRMLDRLAKL